MFAITHRLTYSTCLVLSVLLLALLATLNLPAYGADQFVADKQLVQQIEATASTENANDAPEVKPNIVHTQEKNAQLIAVIGLLTIPFDRGIVADIHRTPVGRKSDGITEFANSLGTPMALAPVIGGLYFLGDKYDKDTAKMALNALINAGIATEGIKTLTGRARPWVTNGAGNFEGPRTTNEYKSFPSGHTSAAFSVATVLAERHPKQKWLYYGLATAVGFARVRKSAHFPSDVLVGAGLGMFAGDRAVHGKSMLISIKF